MRTVRTVVLVGALAACGRPDARPEVPVSEPPAAAALPPMAAGESLAARVERGRTALVRRPGTTTAGDASSDWTAYLAGSQLVLVDDTTSFGDYGASRTRFYYEDGVLRFYREDGTRVATGHGATGSHHIAARIAFDESGAVSASSWRVAGRDSALPPAKAEEARRRAADFLRRMLLP